MAWETIKYKDPIAKKYGGIRRVFCIGRISLLIQFNLFAAKLKNCLKKIPRSNTKKSYLLIRRSNIARAVFLGGDDLPSVRHRCTPVAKALGCDYILGVNGLDKVPSNKDIFICVQPKLSEADLEWLSKRGLVVWDIHRGGFPNSYKKLIACYLVETKSAYLAFQHLKNICIIPPHYMNYSGKFNPFNMQGEISWLGNEKFLPEFKNTKISAYFYHHKTEEEIGAIFRKASIMINMRKQSPENEFYIRVNPGLKLIMCIGYGFPSISDPEPAYLEHAPECTIFSTPEELPEWILRLKNDKRLYSKLRNNCIRAAEKFSLKNIIRYYRRFIRML